MRYSHVRKELRPSYPAIPRQAANSSFWRAVFGVLQRAQHPVAGGTGSVGGGSPLERIRITRPRGSHSAALPSTAATGRSSVVISGGSTNRPGAAALRHHRRGAEMCTSFGSWTDGAAPADREPVTVPAHDRRVISGSERLIIVGGFGLGIASFVPWYQVSRFALVRGRTNGWQEPDAILSQAATILGVAGAVVMLVAANQRRRPRIGSGPSAPRSR